MRIIAITGTDTGVGKTLLTGLLVTHLRRLGCPVAALKPFCSGSRRDATLLAALQDRELTLEQINPFFFAEPVAPLVAARKHNRRVRLPDLLRHVNSTGKSLFAPPHQKGGPVPVLLIEGAGGLFAPLGERFSMADLIRSLECEVIVVGRNKLGIINHALLTAQALRALRVRKVQLVLMNCRRPDVSAKSNRAILAELLAPTTVMELPFLGPRATQPQNIRSSARRLGGRCRRLLA